MVSYLCGFLAAVIAVLVVRKLYRSSQSAKDRHFDEMQLQLRARGYKIGFMTLIVCLVICAFASEFGAFTMFSTGFLMLLIFMIGLDVFVVYCIMKEAFFSVGQNGRLYIGVVLVVLLCNGPLAVMNFIDRSFLVDGQVTMVSGSNLIMALGFAVILGALLMKIFDGKVEDEES